MIKKNEISLVIPKDKDDLMQEISDHLDEWLGIECWCPKAREDSKEKLIELLKEYSRA